MSSRLDLPPERDLPAVRRREIRTELLRATHPPHPRHRRPRAWLLVVPVAVLAALLGLGLTHPWTRTTPVVGLPSPSPAGTTGPTPGRTAPAPVPTPGSSIPAATPIDRGALTPAARTTVTGRCQADLGPRTRVAQVHFARRTSTDGDVVLFTGRDGLSYLCSDAESSLYDGPGSKTKALKAPDAKHPVVRILEPSLGSSAGHGRHIHRTQAGYRVGPDVVSLQLRLTVDGHRSPWFEASRSDGWAWAGATLEYADAHRLILDADFTVEDRAFDADGHPLAIDRTAR